MTAADVTQELPSIVEPVGAPPGYPRPFGAYLLLCPLAHGGMGEVFLASSRGTSGAVRLVVIKTLRPDLAQEPGYVNRFLDEARIVIQLQHTNICQVFDVGKQDGAHFFAMEHIAGTNLRRLIDALREQGKSLPPSIALHVMAEVLEGLASAHRHRHPLSGQSLNVVHRDVSPHNVMVGFDGDVKLIDFGLAASEMKMEHTESQVVMGKIAYMSPEQARGEPVDASSDQFSAAVVLYELLVGERYYGDMNQREIWSTAGGRGYVPRRYAQLDDDVAGVMRRALSDDRKARWPTCVDFADALRSISKQRYPFADKSMVRSFVRDVVALELEASERTLRNLGSIAMTAMPPTESGMQQSQARGLPPSQGGTGSTRTWMVFGKRPPAWPLAAMAAVGGLALGALGVLLVVPLARDAAPAPVVSAPVVSAPVLAPVVSAPVVAGADKAGGAVEEERAVEEPAVEERTVVKQQRRRKERKPERVAERPAWIGWSDEKKLAALESCTHLCARSIRAIKKKGEAVQSVIVDGCLESCAVRK